MHFAVFHSGDTHIRFDPSKVTHIAATHDNRTPTMIFFIGHTPEAPSCRGVAEAPDAVERALLEAKNA